MRGWRILAGVLAAGLAGASPVRAQWALQRLDQYNMVTNDPRHVVVTEAYADGIGGWRMRVACAPGGRWVLMLGRGDLWGPPGPAQIRLGVTVTGPAGERLFSGEIPMQWARRTFEGVMPPALAAALAQGARVDVFGGSRIADRFGLAGSGAALGVLRPCQMPHGAAVAPDRRPSTDAWQYRDGGGVWASARIDLPGHDRSIGFFCTRPDRARFLAWAQRTPDANHVPFVPDGFQMDFSAGLWPERLSGGRAAEEGERRLRIVVGPRQLDGVVQHAGPEDYFLIQMGSGAPLFAVIEEGERHGERMLVREDERVLAAVPLSGATAAIARARTFCGGPTAAVPAPLPPVPSR